MTDLSGKVAIVLGASAKGGTGWAVAERYAAAGARVVVGARRLEPLNALAERIGGLAVACDAGEEDQVAALADAAISAYGRLDVAVNSAGLPVFGRIADITPDLLLEAAKYNYFAQAYFFKHMGRVMSDGGSMIAISSISSVLFNGHISPYACAKAAANCLVKYAAVEYGPRGIRVNAILPGPIRSEMAQELLAVPGMEEAFTREVSLGRIGEPADFADACLWLAGGAYITGESLHINGGMQLNRFPRAEEFPGGGPPFYEVAS